MHADKLLHKDLTYKIIGILYRVHTALGCGFTEKIYQRAIVIELEKENLSYEIEKEFEVRYKGQVVGRYRLDLVIEGKVIVELKAVERMPKLYEEQLISQLKASPYEVGLLVNYGASKLKYIRFVQSKSV